MDRSEFEQLCISCSEELETRFPGGLVEHVRVSLSGGERLGAPRHMTGPFPLTEVAAAGALLVAMVREAIEYITLRVNDSGGADGTPKFEADLEAIDIALTRAIEDLGRAQRPQAEKVKAEVVQWLKQRANA